jgi:hypothetical protein
VRKAEGKMGKGILEGIQGMNGKMTRKEEKKGVLFWLFAS